MFGLPAALGGMRKSGSPESYWTGTLLVMDHSSGWHPGYPIDLRSPKAQAVAFKSVVSPDFEYMVGRVLARFTGERVLLQDDGSRPRMPDLRIEYADGRDGYVEVSMDVDPGIAQVAASLAKSTGDRATHRDSRLSRDWHLRVNSSFKLRGWGERVANFLVELEARGFVYEYVPRPDNLGVHPGPHVTQAQQLGIEGLSSHRASDEGGGEVTFNVWRAGGSNITDWAEFHDWVDGHLNESSRNMLGNRQKLSEAGGNERHLVVGITLTTPWPVLRAMRLDAEGEPSRPPLLPPEVTHLWLIGAQVSDRCWAWYPDRGWFDPMTYWSTE